MPDPDQKGATTTTTGGGQEQNSTTETTGQPATAESELEAQARGTDSSSKHIRQEQPSGPPNMSGGKHISADGGKDQMSHHEGSVSDQKLTSSNSQTYESDSEACSEDEGLAEKEDQEDEEMVEKEDQEDEELAEEEDQEDEELAEREEQEDEEGFDPLDLEEEKLAGSSAGKQISSSSSGSTPRPSSSNKSNPEPSTTPSTSAGAGAGGGIMKLKILLKTRPDEKSKVYEIV